MKTDFMKQFIYLMLIASISFVGCSTDDDDSSEPEATGKIPGLTASLSSNNGRSVKLTFQDVTDGEYGYSIYHSEDGGEFDRIKGNLNDTSYWNERTDYGKTYRMFVNYESMYSDTIEIATTHPARPWLDVGAATGGEGSSAYIRYIKLDFFVGEEHPNDIVDKFEYYRNGELIEEYDLADDITYWDNHFDYRDESSSLSFDQEYTYYIAAITYEGDVHKSYEHSVTPRRPDPIDRPAPEITGVSSDHDNEIVYIHIKDESESASMIEIYAELNDGEWVWDGEFTTGELETDDDGSYKYPLGTEDAPGGFSTLRSKAKVEIQGIYSDWSGWNTTTIIN